MSIGVNFVNLGLKSFADAYRIQIAVSSSLIRKSTGHFQVKDELESYERDILEHVDGTNTILLVEHPAVYTVGLRNEKRPTKEEINKLRSKGADYEETNRGGLITFHGPGQLVAYPIISLKEFNIGMRTYVSSLEKTLIETCSRFNVSVETTKDTGVWINNNKIAAIGVNARRYVTTHGVALNCDIDLSWFDYITPCGLIDKGVTSLTRETGMPVSVEETIPLFIDSFSKVFNVKSNNLIIL